MPTSYASRPTDARARRSRESLRGALQELLQIKPFDQISIREITLVAHVSYPTFFRSYSSKVELLGEIGIEQTHQLFSSMTGLVEKRDSAISAFAICNFVKERRNLWVTLLSSEASFAMRRTFIEEALRFAGENTRMMAELPMDLAASFVVSTIFDVLSWWLAQPEDFPISKVSRYLQLLALKPTMAPS